MALDLAAQASQAATQGQQMLQSDQSQANTSRDQFNNFSGQATAANKAVGDYTDYMKGAGAAGNQYNTELTKQSSDLGYDPAQMAAARGNLNQSTGALSAYSDFANTGASKFGLNAGGFAAANAGALGGINNNIASNQGVVNGLSDLYKTAQTGANQFTGQVVQGEQNTLGGLQQVFSNAANQRDQAGSMMQFFNQLASSQGGLNAQQQQYYGQAQQAYAGATAALAQAGLYGSQSAQIRQQMGFDANSVNQKAQANSDNMYQAMNHSSPAPPTPNANPSTGYSMNDLGHDIRGGASSLMNNFQRSLGFGSSQPSASQQALNAQRAAGRL
jgi:hypothetical protein